MVLPYAGYAAWDPFSEIQRLQTDMNRLFEDFARPAGGREYPAINLWLGDKSVVATAELPGLSADDINLTIREDTLAIQGERTLAANDNQMAWHRRERGHGAFSRTIELPFRVDPDRVEARFENGLLEIEMQRPEAYLPRKIEISAK